MTTKNAKTKTEKSAEKILSPLYADFLKAFKAEEKAVAKTTATIEAIASTSLTVTEFFDGLWSEGYKIPKNWPLNSSGKPLSPRSGKTKAALPEINRLVSALDMRKSRAKKAQKKAEKKAEKKATSPDSTESVDPVDSVDSVDSAPRVDEVNIPSFDPVLLVESLQGFMLAVAQGDCQLKEKDAKEAHKLCKRLVELAQKA